MGLVLSSRVKKWHHEDQNPESGVELEYPTGTEQSESQPEPCSEPLTARQRHFHQRVRLHKAALQGDWEAAEELIGYGDLAKGPITEGGETALHLAAAEGHVYFVEKLLGRRNASDLQIQNKKQKTALCFAAAGGHVGIAKKMVEQDRNLIRREGFTPLLIAARQGNKEMANYLFQGSDFKSWKQEDQIEVLTRSIHSGLYGLAVEIVRQNKELAVAEDRYHETPLLALARKPLAFCGTSRKRFWGNIASTSDDAYKLLDCLWRNITDQEDVENALLPEHISQLLFDAAESENDDFVVELIRRYPDFIYKANDLQHTIFHIAILHRSVKVFNLTYELHGVKDLMISFIDVEGNNVLHLAAKLPRPNILNSIPGAALQMQREVLWYKEVEKIVPPSFINMKNNDGVTPYELFLKEHDNLMKEGEKQIKQIAKSCMLVTTLITTIVFTTAFTAPGGFNDKGAPILQHKKLFMVLPISEAIATLASLISMLMFLSVLTSRYSDNDFLRSLPIWLVVGVAALFVSIAAMMVAFCICLFFYGPGLAVMTVLVVLFASVPIIFLILKYPLLFTILRCTYSSKWLFRSNKRLFS